MEIIFLDLLVHVRQQLIVRNTDDQLHPNPFSVLECPVDLRLALHVNRPDGITGHAIRGALLMKRPDLLIRTVERQMEILDAKIMNVQTSQGRQRRLQVKINKRIARHSQMERIDSRSRLGLSGIRSGIHQRGSAQQQRTCQSLLKKSSS